MLQTLTPSQMVSVYEQGSHPIISIDLRASIGSIEESKGPASCIKSVASLVNV